jgi:hypothetical protein
MVKMMEGGASNIKTHLGRVRLILYVLRRC